MTLTSRPPDSTTRLASALTTAGAVDPADPAVAKIAGWLSRLMRLQGVPFHYLVPDPLMLPDESIRFFIVDENWIACLVDGAYSIGQTMVGLAPGAQAVQAASFKALAQNGLGQGVRSGFVLRSAAVVSYPGLRVTGALAGTQPAPLLRYEILAPGLAFALFDGLLQSVTFSEPTETLPFGLQAPVEAGGPYTKALRYADPFNGSDAGQPILDAGNEPVAVAVPFRGASPTVVDITALATAVQQGLLDNHGMEQSRVYSAAQFGMELVEGAEEVSFDLTGEAPSAGSQVGVSS